MPEIVVDTSAIIAVITHEPDRSHILSITIGKKVCAPHSLHWEIGNAFSAMFKKKRLTKTQALEAIELYQRIPIDFVDISISKSITLASRFGIYAYDAYILMCALERNSPLLSLDGALIKTAEALGIECLIKDGE